MVPNSQVFEVVEKLVSMMKSHHYLLVLHRILPKVRKSSYHATATVETPKGNIGIFTHIKITE